MKNHGQGRSFLLPVLQIVSSVVAASPLWFQLQMDSPSLGGPSFCWVSLAPGLCVSYLLMHVKLP